MMKFYPVICFKTSIIIKWFQREIKVIFDSEFFRKNSLFRSLINCVNNLLVQFVRCSVMHQHISAKTAVYRLADNYFNHDDRFSINLLFS